MSPPPRFELDAGVHRGDDGRLLVGGTPPRLVRLSQAGAAALDDLLRGQGAGSLALAERLAAGGMIHPLPGDGGEGPAVTAIVPVLDGGERLARLVATLAAEGPTIVVDDGSRDGSAERAAQAGAHVIRHPSPRGPAAARNAGLAAATTEIVAFLDADCELAPDWRRGLADLFAADPRLALLGPRVRSVQGGSAIARYEKTRSPLDLGPDASLVGPTRRIAYLPAAALLAHREALLALGGFDESMRFGEDVDLVWRLLAGGGRVRYVPSRTVTHRPRQTVVGFVRQRIGYGSSAPELVRRHGSAAAPLRASRHSIAIWGAAALFGPRALVPAMAASTAIVARRGGDLPSRRLLAEVALSGQVGSATHLARVLTREWLPLALAASTFSRRARVVLLAAFAADSLPVWIAVEAAADIPSATVLHALDRGAYATGMWGAMARSHDFRATRPGGS